MRRPLTRPPRARKAKEMARHAENAAEALQRARAGRRSRAADAQAHPRP